MTESRISSWRPFDLEPVLANGLEQLRGEAGVTGRPPWAKVPSRAFVDGELRPGPLKVLGLVCTRAARTGWCWVRIKNLAEELDVDRRTVERHLIKLQALGYISKRSRVPGRRGSYWGWRVLYDEGGATSRVASHATPSAASNPTSSVVSQARRSREVNREAEQSVVRESVRRVIRPSIEEEVRRPKSDLDEGIVELYPPHGCGTNHPVGACPLLRHEAIVAEVLSSSTRRIDPVEALQEKVAGGAWA